MADKTTDSPTPETPPTTAPPPPAPPAAPEPSPPSQPARPRALRRVAATPAEASAIRRILREREDLTAELEEILQHAGATRGGVRLGVDTSGRLVEVSPE